ncbi:MAG: hypothetical protein L3J06_08110, partial [Cyclobacteriaceae bacterium]|nr:hypothetical protein [Cyclobacteriaceae bacterium]
VTIDLRNDALLGSFALRLTYSLDCELRTVRLLPAPHICFRLNDKLVYVILSYYWVFNYN